MKQTADPEHFQIVDLHVRLGLPVREVARVYFSKYKIGTRLKREVEQLQWEGGPC